MVFVYHSRHFKASNIIVSIENILICPVIKQKKLYIVCTKITLMIIEKYDRCFFFEIMEIASEVVVSVCSNCAEKNRIKKFPFPFIIYTKDSKDAIIKPNKAARAIKTVSRIRFLYKIDIKQNFIPSSVMPQRTSCCINIIIVVWGMFIICF